MTDQARNDDGEWGPGRVGSGAAVTAIVAALLTAGAGCNLVSGADDLQTSSGSQAETSGSGGARDPSTSADAGRAADASSSSSSSTSSQNGSTSRKKLECDGRECSGATPSCCQRSGSRATCVADDAPCDGARLTCDGPGDCGAGEVCCGMTVTGLAQCLPVAGCGMVSGERLCNHDDDCPGSQTCSGRSEKFDHATCE